MGGGASGGGRATRALRLLLLLVLALAAVEYLFGSILEASPLRTYLYTPIYNATQPSLKLGDKSPSSWPKLPASIQNPETKDSHDKNNTTIINKPNVSHNRTESKIVFVKDKITVTKTGVVAKNRTETKIGFVTNNITDINIEPSKSDITANINMTVNVTEKAMPAYNATPLLITKILDGIKQMVTTEGDVFKKSEPPLPLCDKLVPDLEISYTSEGQDAISEYINFSYLFFLKAIDEFPINEWGPVPVNKTEIELEDVENKFPDVFWGGRYSPPNCTARHKVAIIVPYRDRQQHLAIFLNHMHPFLMKQQIEYGIFVVEQEGHKEFNRAKLMNVGFMEAQRLKAGGWQCFIFHDIDLLPMDTRNLYSCPKQPRHMSASIDKLNFMLPYDDIFGGVSAMTLEQFTKVNGFSNKYWGWGGEDDDMFYRIKKRGYHIARYKMSIARYAMLDHKKSVPNPKRYQLLSQTSQTFQRDGLSTLEYQLIQVAQFHLYTHILVNIDERS